MVISMMKPLVSVIVPVYKVEPYLERCLGSLVNQTLKEIEIIVIDDGSPDRCGEICDFYAARDERFRVVHQENRGLSAARNVGIDLAQADYLMFVDSDDWVDPEYCRLPYEAALRYSVDMVIFQYTIVKNGNQLLKLQGVGEGILSRDEAMRILFHGPAVAVWNKLYHRKLFAEKRFLAGRLCEDLELTHRIVYAADAIVFLKACLYYYQIREGSITQSPIPQFYNDRLEMMKLQCLDLKRWGYYDLAKERSLRMCLSYLYAEGRYARYSNECISYCCSKHQIADYLHWKRKVMLLLLRFAPPLFDLVCIITGKRIR